MTCCWDEGKETTDADGDRKFSSYNVLVDGISLLALKSLTDKLRAPGGKVDRHSQLRVG